MELMVHQHGPFSAIRQGKSQTLSLSADRFRVLLYNIRKIWRKSPNQSTLTEPLANSKDPRALTTPVVSIDKFGELKAMPLIAGIDIGGGSAKLGIIDPRGTIVARDEMSTPSVSTSDELAEAYACGIGRLFEAPGAGNTIGIAVGIPGHLDESSLTPTFTNVPLLDNYPLAAFLEQRFLVPVRLDNDATLAALAEHDFGAGHGAKRLLVVTLGTGIGLGLVIDGQPQRPVRRCIGDPGHIIVDPEGRWACRQGCRGCLESVASSLALERDAADMASWQRNSRMGAILARAGRIRADEVIKAAQDGDDAAVTLLEKLGTWLGIATASWCALYDPDLILFGGGVSSAGPLLVSPIHRTMNSMGMPAYVAGPEIGLAKLGNDAGLIGAASLFADCLEG